MTCTEEYKEHIEYTFQAFCKVVIRNAAITAARTRSRKYKREISLEYLTDEKHYPLGNGLSFLFPAYPTEGDRQAIRAEPQRSGLPYSQGCPAASRRNGGNDA